MEFLTSEIKEEKQKGMIVGKGGINSHYSQI